MITVKIVFFCEIKWFKSVYCTNYHVLRSIQRQRTFSQLFLNYREANAVPAAERRLSEIAEDNDRIFRLFTA